LRGTSITGYGVNLTVGIGVPIPILNEQMLEYTAVRDEEIYALVVDYSKAYPEGGSEVLEEVNYAQLKSGMITIRGKEVPTAGFSSYAKAKEITDILKGWIKRGEFLLSEPIQLLPSVNARTTFKNLKERPIKK
jgi:uncharacterized protein (DUF39 family)